MRAAAEALGIISMTKDLGYSVKGEVWSDANAAIGIINRNGLGKTRHIDVLLLWIQEAARAGVIRLKKIDGSLNPADMLTKPLQRKYMERHVQRVWGACMLCGNDRSNMQGIMCVHRC